MQASENLKLALLTSMAINGDPFKDPVAAHMTLQQHQDAEGDDSGRTLTDADVGAIVQQLASFVTGAFYEAVGKAVWKLVQGSIITAMILLAAWYKLHGGG